MLRADAGRSPGSSPPDDSSCVPKIWGASVVQPSGLSVACGSSRQVGARSLEPAGAGRPTCLIEKKSQAGVPTATVEVTAENLALRLKTSSARGVGFALAPAVSYCANRKLRDVERYTFAVPGERCHWGLFLALSMDEMRVSSFPLPAQEVDSLGPF